MKRLDNWQNNLSSLIEKYRYQPFQWGTLDCALFATFAIEAVSGLNIYRPYLGNYTDALGARKLLKSVDGVKRPNQLMRKYLSPRKPAAMARRGDIVCGVKGDYEVPEYPSFGPVVGVCYGATSFFVGEFGLVSVPTMQVRNCYHVVHR